MGKGGGGGGGEGLEGQRGEGAAKRDLVWEPSEVLARTVGEGVKKMAKKRKGYKGERRRRGAFVCLHVIITVLHR